jgi:hypothetical protein
VPLLDQELAHPSLTPLHRLHGLKKISATTTHGFITKCPEVGNGQALFGRRREKEKPKRCQRGLSQGLQLPKRGLAFACLPLPDLWELPLKGLQRPTGPVDRPTQNLSFDSHSAHLVTLSHVRAGIRTVVPRKLSSYINLPRHGRRNQGRAVLFQLLDPFAS